MVIEACREAFADPSQHEPQLVANLIWHLVAYAADQRLKQSLQVAGVFVHGQPLVTCGNFPEVTPKSVEIGDLLLLRSQLGPSGPNRRGLLLQVKKTARIPTTPNNKNQHHLYATWPRFTYSRGMGKLNGKKRRLAGVDLVNASQYLLLPAKATMPTFASPCCCELEMRCWAPCYPFCHPFIAHATQPDLSHYRCFVNALVAFILGDAGKFYNAPPPKGDNGWSRVIHDLVSVTGTRISDAMKRASAGVSGERWCFWTGKSERGSLPKFEVTPGGPPNISQWGGVPGDNGGGGISIVEIIVGAASQ